MNYKNLSIVFGIVAIVFIGVSVYAIATYPVQQAPPAPLTINGAGATFPAPLYQEMAAVYYNLTGVKINYQGVGSGTGVNDFNASVVDFAASDPPLTASQYAYFVAHGYQPLQIPMTIGGITFAYNVPGITGHLNFTGNVLAAIFQGNITYWDDANITSLNPAVTLPHQAIVVCHRSDSSGSTKITSTFLHDYGAGQYGGWKIGVANIVSWGSGTLGGTGNPGVAALIGHNQYSIGYVELQYALGSNLTYGNVRNPAGNFVTPSLASLTATIQTTGSNLPANGSADFSGVHLYLGYYLTPSNAGQCYPVTSFSYIIVCQNLKAKLSDMTLAKAMALRAFLLWAVNLNQGQTYGPALSYVPLPANVVALDDATIGSIYYA